jgi:adenylate kinase
VQNLIVTGGPGTGKTTSGQITVVMAISRGLVMGIMAIMSVQAKQLGGVHVSSLFCIPVNEYASPQRLAEMALMKLFRRPKLMAYLRQMDVLYFDELGLLSDKIMSMLDIIF